VEAHGSGFDTDPGDRRLCREVSDQLSDAADSGPVRSETGGKKAPRAELREVASDVR
jgi:hypothetical protein